ncbi:MAG: sigma-54-dependent Fis family transcriptional regulator [Myxococcales bacterium]|nr:MAG: sigma-54-dependent Fis family transcriptional regulator [Myxococcales bacterium]
MVKRGLFREDLLYRLNVIPIDLPPLRKRKADIPELVAHFINKSNTQRNRNVSGITDEALAILQSYAWPGNVRELENTIERMVVMRSKGQLSTDDIPERLLGITQQPGLLKDENHILPVEGIDLCEVLAQIEDTFIDQALSRTGGNKTRAAELLHVNRTTLVAILKAKLAKKEAKQIAATEKKSSN